MQVTYNIATPIINKFVSIIVFSCHYQENPLQALPTFTVYLNGLLVYEMTKRMLDNYSSIIRFKDSIIS